MKVFLDDERKEPKGWFKTVDVGSTIDLLDKLNVTDLSLDHDLGLDNECGYDVLLWIEKQVFTNNIDELPLISIHTANPSARIKMELCLNRIINKFYRGI